MRFKKKVKRVVRYLLIFLIMVGFLLLIISLSLLGCGRHKNLMNVLNALDVSMTLDRDYEIRDYGIIKDGTIEVKEIFTKSKEDILDIKVISGLSEEKATLYVDDQRYLIDNLFSKQKVPYPGPLTNTLECPENYLPKIEEKQDEHSWGIFYYLYANKRLAFGGCADDILDYTAVVAFIYCKEKNEFYQIEYFTPKENPTQNYRDIVKSFKCRK